MASTKSPTGPVPCINMYDITLRDDDESGGCGLYQWPHGLDRMKSYLSRGDVRKALHVDGGKDVKWTECRNSVAERLSHDESESGGKVLPDVLDKVKVLVFTGDHDLVCNADGLEAAFSEMTWNGVKGFGPDATVLGWYLKDSGDASGLPAGVYTTARNLTHVIVFGASHMVGVTKKKESLDLFARFVGEDAGVGGVLTKEIPPSQPLIAPKSATFHRIATAMRYQDRPKKHELDSVPTPSFGVTPFGRVKISEHVDASRHWAASLKGQMVEGVGKVGAQSFSFDDAAFSVREEVGLRVNYAGHRNWA
ncbi:Cell death protease [Phlyctochytrium planicorne]|nr:Cell death protease [Phlyctochytrium planicorne]